MATDSTGVAALMSLRPEFAERILSGEKQVEFRKRRFSRAVSHVVIYASAPVQRVVGLFEVEGIDEGSPRDLWRRYSAVGGVAEHEFDSYYEGDTRGYAIRVGRVFELLEPLTLTDVMDGCSPPQSFRYVDGSVAEQLVRVADPQRVRGRSSSARSRLACLDARS